MPQTTRLSSLSATKLAVLATQAYAQVEDVLHAEPIAIIGMGCRFPGGADNPAAYWEILRNGVDAIVETPADRWDADAYYAEDFAAPGKMNTRRGGFLKQIDGFDAAFFGISPREAERMDPQQRLLLEVAYEALQDADLTRRRLAGSQTGVFIASYHNDYTLRQYSDPNSINLRTLTGTLHSIAANRISFLLDLRGPSLALDTACSSSLVAVHLACQSLRSRESDMCLAGGVSLMVAPELNIALAKVGFMSPDGTCYTFDSRAAGFGRGEGCGVIVLKRLADALVDGDHVLAVVRGSAVNQDGRSTLLTAPNGQAQRAVVRTALQRAGVAPEQVSHIEAHGTGTLLGDPIEVEALIDVLSPPGGSESALPCALTSVKTNFGHLEAAAGIAGLIKVVLSLQHEAIPPHLRLQTLNPHASLEGTRLFIPTEETPWRAGANPRIAGISSFGIGGTNAHVVIGEAPARAATPLPAADQQRTCLLPISAGSPEALAELVAQYATFLRGVASDLGTYNICSAAALRRNHYACRLAVVGNSPAELADRLQAARAADALTTRNGRALETAAGVDLPAVVFVFSGQGPQWYAMGRELLAQETVFRAVVEQCDALLLPLAGWSLLAELQADEAASRIDQTEVAQPLIFALQMGLDALWRSWGIEPAAVIGHSVGEIAAACSSGALTLAQAITLVYHRSRLMQRATGNGRMASVELPADAVRQLIAPYASPLRNGDRLSLAAINGPTTTVIAGETAALQAVLDQLTQQQISSRELRVNYAFHSAQMAPLADELVRVLADLGWTPGPAAVPVYSTVTGGASDGHNFDAAYWGRNMRQTVRFADAVQSAAQDGLHLFVELSPHPVLAGVTSDCLAAAGLRGTALASLRRQRPEREGLLGTLAELYAWGCDVNWDALYPTAGMHVDLPLYAWQRQRYWFEPATPTGSQYALPPLVRPDLLGPALRSPAIEGVLFQSTLAADSPAYLTDHRIFGCPVLPATAYLAMATAAGRQLWPGMAVEVAGLVIHAPLLLPEKGEQALTVQLHLRESSATPSFKIFSAAGEGDWTLHAEGELRQLQAVGTAFAPDAAALRPQLPDQIDAADYYRQLAERGLGFGPAFRGLALIRRRVGEVLAELALPPDLAQVADGIHPALLDAALQGLSAALPSALADTVYLPLGVDSLRLLRAPGAQLMSYLRLRGIGQAQGGDADSRQVEAGGHSMLVCDVTLLDEAGVVAEIAGLRLRRADAATLRRMADRRQGQSVEQWFHTVDWQPLPAAAPADAQPHTAAPWLIFADGNGVETDVAAFALADRLRNAGLRVYTVTAAGLYGRQAEDAWTIDANNRDDYSRLLGELPAGDLGVVHMWSLDAPPVGAGALDRTAVEPADGQERSLRSVLYLAQALAAADHKLHGLWLVTRGSQVVGRSAESLHTAPAVEQSPLWGMAATLALELPDLQPRCVDLDLNASPEEDAAALWSEIAAAPGEQQVAWRSGQRHGLRQIDYAPAAREGASGGFAGQPAHPLALGQVQRGLLDNLALFPAPRQAPGPGEVEIRVHAAGLNFRDVLKALDQYPWDLGPLGDECAGEVVALGAGVDGLAVGQRVLAVAPAAFRSYAIARAELVAPLPAGMSFAQGASIPIAFLTAAYTLEHLGRLKARERVLIHAAAGGVGLAAVQIAQRLGAEIFATAGSEKKRAYLRSLGVAHVFDSRSLAFAGQIKELTGGVGVDVVLNSLAGDFIEASLSLLAPGGRFLEIGKSGLLTPAAAAALGEGRQYYSVFLGDQFVQEPQMIQALLANLLSGFAAGELRPLPLRTFEFGAAATAFRLMAQARHIGKIVLLPPLETGVAVVEFSADATYLITGGLGGIGQVVARHLVAWGAHHLVLAGRHGEQTPGARELCRELEAVGAHVLIAAVDVADRAQVDDLLGTLRGDDAGPSTARSWPPLRGIIHAAGIVDDGSVLQLTWERMRAVLAPKLQGAWNLHLLTQQEPLDFFICFSSLAGLQGAAGQSSYAAANRFLVALAHLRRTEGLPALTIDWGAWGEVGMAARLDAGDYSRWLKRGMAIIAPERGAEALRLALQQPVAHLVIAPAADGDGATSAPRRQDGAAAGQGKASGQDRPDLIARWESTPPSLRRTLLLDTVRQGAIRTIGLRSDTLIDPGQPLHDLGLDSLMAVELRNLLGAACGTTLPATLLFDYPTTEAVVAFLLTHVPAFAAAETDSAPDSAPGSADTPASAAPGAGERQRIEELSDEEAEALLLAELEQLGSGEINQ